MKNRSRILAIAAAAPLALAGAGIAAAAQPSSTPGPELLTNNVAPGLAHAQLRGALPDNQQLPVAVSLKLRDAAGLDQFIKEVNDPHSAQYKHYLTPAQFLDRYAPSTASVDKVRAFLTSKGLHVSKVTDNRQAIDATGTAAQLRDAFGTQIGTYYDASQHRNFFANESAPSLPSDVASDVQAIAGLDNHYAPHHNLVKNTSPAKRHGGGHHATPSGYGPSDYRGAYDAGSADGSGTTVALWEFDGFSQSDINTYDQQYGLNSPAPTTVSVDGGSAPSGTDGQLEVTLDIEAVQAVAPAAKQIVYEAPEPADIPSFEQEELDEANQIVSDDKASIVSMSWGWYEGGRDASQMQAEDNAFKQGAAEGIGWFAASGDSGSDDGGNGGTSVDFPASDPNITGVGGTTLTTSGGSYGGETAWSGSGGGTSTVFAAPSFQTGVNGKRTVPDVAADADPSTGAAVYAEGSWNVVGGTSLATPLWGGFAALYDQQAAAAGKPALGDANTALYNVAKGSSYSSTFHDVTSGSNGAFSAGTGYDQVTGWGSYDASKLTQALLGG
ncbi:MAG: S8/S53 family peptidase [Sciscionella sp.]|nr:S8/S53 family peptidase [Sciscionella sp.]